MRKPGPGQKAGFTKMLYQSGPEKGVANSTSLRGVAMKFELKDMYGFLLSHTFPGVLVLMEILLYLQWIAKVDVSGFLKQVWSSSAGGVVVLLILGYAFSTLLGNILDGVHHFFIEDVLRKKQKEEKFQAISDNVTMNIYKHFLEDDLWYPYEGYANISFAIISWLWASAGIGYHRSCTLMVGVYGCHLLTVVLVIVFWDAIYTYSNFLRDETKIRLMCIY